jgi:hypothetical protein
MNPDSIQPNVPPMVALIGIAHGSDFVTETVEAADLVFGGIRGDLHSGLTRPACSRTRWHPRGTTICNTRQLSILSVEECAEIAELLRISCIDPRLLGANMVTTGLPELTTLACGTRLQFPSGATLFITEENRPCRQPGAKLADARQQARLETEFPRAAMGRRGLVCLVEREGRIVTGDAIKVIAPHTQRRMLATRTAPLILAAEAVRQAP